MTPLSEWPWVIRGLDEEEDCKDSAEGIYLINGFAARAEEGRAGAEGIGRLRGR